MNGLVSEVFVVRECVVFRVGVIFLWCMSRVIGIGIVVVVFFIVIIVRVEVGGILRVLIMFFGIRVLGEISFLEVLVSGISNVCDSVGIRSGRGKVVMEIIIIVVKVVIIVIICVRIFMSLMWFLLISLVNYLFKYYIMERFIKWLGWLYLK